MKIIFTLSVFMMVILPYELEARNEFRIPKDEFHRSIHSLQVTPVNDSLRFCVLQLINKINDHIMKDSEGHDSFYVDMRDKDIESTRNRYLITAQFLKLNDSTARDSILRTIDAEVYDFLLNKSIYQIIPISAVMDSLSILSCGIIRTSLKLSDTTKTNSNDIMYYGQSVGYSMAFVTSCAIMIESSICDESGKTLWSNSAAVAIVGKDKTMSELFSNKNIKAAVKKVFNPLF
jgi:hypothetical protein